MHIQKEGGTKNMKRMTAVLLALLLLAGCSSTEEPSMVTKACSIEYSGMLVVAEAAAQSEEDNIETITININFSWSDIGIDDEYLDYLTDEFIEALEDQLESMLLSSGLLEDIDYVEITTEFDDTGLDFVAVIDVQAMAEAEGYSYYDISLSAFTTEMEAVGYSCD